MRISQLAERSGVPASTLRFYETAGLLPAGRTASGYRVYGPEATQRLAFIGAAKQLGLPLGEIAELLGTWQRGSCTEVKAGLRPRIAARLQEAAERAAQLAAFTASLRRALQQLDELPDRAGRCDPECGFPGTPGPGGPGAVPLGSPVLGSPVLGSPVLGSPGPRVPGWRSALAAGTGGLLAERGRARGAGKRVAGAGRRGRLRAGTRRAAADPAGQPGRDGGRAERGRAGVLPVP